MAVSVSCVELEKRQAMLRTDGHAWAGDLSAEMGGDGLAPSPFDMLLGAVAFCIVVTVRNYATQSKIAVEKLWADVEGEWVGEGDEKHYQMKARLRVRGQLEDSDVERLLRAARRCPVHNAIMHGLTVDMNAEQA